MAQDSSAASPSLELLQLLSGNIDLHPPRNRRVFVNRNLRMDKIDWIGFDMDYTLLRYRPQEMGALLYEKALDQVCVALKLPESVRAHCQFDLQRVTRGVIVDKERGNLLKMTGHRHVKRVVHGHQKLSKTQRKSYRGQRLSLSAAQKFRLLDTQFCISEICLYTDLVAWMDQLPDDSAHKLDYKTLYDVVRENTDLAHANGTIHQAIQADIDRYVYYDIEIAKTLHRFRMSGKRLFLLTNSDWEYTAHLMEYLLSNTIANTPHWQDFFDLVIVRAKKPSFFSGDQPFECLNAQGETLGFEAQPKDVRWMRGGNLKGLHDMLGVLGERVLYVGDHIYGDILRSKKTSTWRTMLILEELEQEIDRVQDVAHAEQRWHALEEQRQYIDAELTYQRMLFEQLQSWHVDDQPTSNRTMQEKLHRSAIQRTERSIQQLQRQLDQVVEVAQQLHVEIERRFNPSWGRLFREGSESSYIGEQIRNYACVYASRVSNLLFYNPQQYFRAPVRPLPHE